MSPVDEDTLAPVRSFDAQGQVFLGQSRVLRGIFPGQGERNLQILDLVTRHDLFRLGIVRTVVATGVELPGGPYELVLEHERLPFVSYPHEWSASMLKDAALFHLDLFRELAPYGLTLKDMHPLNILFDGPKPVFVDFTSIIPVDALSSEAYLQSAARPAGPIRGGWDRQSVLVNEMYDRMFVPYFMRPLEMMSERRYAEARRRMLETTLNTSSEVITPQERGRTTLRSSARDRWGRLVRDVALRDADPMKRRFYRRAHLEVSGIDVAPPNSPYVSFYADKGEDFALQPSPAWNRRHWTIKDVLDRFRPRTVLDVAGNTGWFARLAAESGAHAASFDIDESSADRLYLDSKGANSSVLSLVIDLLHPTEDVVGNRYEDEPRREFEDAPVLLSAASRLRSELVLALAIVHHLALGQGRSFSDIAARLDVFTGRCLAVEFIDRQDRMIVSEPTFFPAMHQNPGGFAWYTLENFETELRKRFASVDRLPSNPESRTILLCAR